jgi:hypothetical protein
MSAQAIPETTEESALVSLESDSLEQNKDAAKTNPGTEGCAYFCCSYTGQRWDLYCNGVYQGTFRCPDQRCYRYCC